MQTFELIHGFEIEGKKYETNQLEKNGIYTINKLPYDYVSNFIDGHSVVIKNNFAGAINKKGEQIIPCCWKDIEIAFNGYFIVKSIAGLYTYIDLDGKMASDIFYKEAHYVTEGMGLVRLDDTFNYLIMGTNKYLNEIGYKEAYPFTEGLAAVKNIDSNKWGFINKDNEYVVSSKYVRVRPFCYGLAAVMNEKGLWGYIDKTGNEVIPLMYEEAYSFSKEGAVVIFENEALIINEENKVISPFETPALSDSIDYMLDCSNKHPYQIGDEMIYIDYKDKLSEEEYEEVYIKYDPSYKFGLTDKNDEPILTPTYDEMSDFYDGFARVRLGDEEGHIDKVGRLLISGTLITTKKLNETKVYRHIKAENRQIKYVNSKLIYGLKIKDNNLIYCKWFDNIEERAKYIENNNQYINQDSHILTKRLQN